MADAVVASDEDSPVKKTPKRKKLTAATPKSALLSQSRLPGAPSPSTPRLAGPSTPSTPRTLGSATKNKLACFALDVSCRLVCGEGGRPMRESVFAEPGDISNLWEML